MLWSLLKKLNMGRSAISPRFRAFLFHGVVSLIIAVAAMLLMFSIWYPAPLHQALGVTRVFLLLLVVDLVLGPLMTLLVFKSGKKNLALDVAIIVVLQLSALGYGLWTVASGRPLWVVFNVDRFDVVQAVDIDVRRLSEALPEFRQGSWLGPEWVGAVRPTDQVLSQQILFESALGGSDLAQHPELYRPLSHFSHELQIKALPLERLWEFNEPDEIAEVSLLWPQATGWLPMRARAQSMVVLLSSDNREVLTIVPLNPW